MKTVRASWKGSWCWIVCGIVLGAGTDALAQTAEKATKPKEKAANPLAGVAIKILPKASQPAAEPVKLKIFHIPRHDPQGVLVTAQVLLGGQSSPAFWMAGGLQLGGLGGIGMQAPGGPPAGLGALGGNLGALGGNLGALGGNLGALGGAGIGGIGGFAGIGGAGIGGIGGGFAGMIRGAVVYGVTTGQTRLVVDPRSRSLMVRGPERDVQVIADLVAVLDAASKKTLPKVKNLHVFKLKHANPESVASAVHQLGIDARVTPLLYLGGPIPEEEGQESPRLLFVRGSEEQLREIRQVIEAMDVRAKEEDEGPGA